MARARELALHVVDAHVHATHTHRVLVERGARGFGLGDRNRAFEKPGDRRMKAVGPGERGAVDRRHARLARPRPRVLRQRRQHRQIVGIGGAQGQRLVGIGIGEAGIAPGVGSGIGRVSHGRSVP